MTRFVLDVTKYPPVIWDREKLLSITIDQAYQLQDTDNPGLCNALDDYEQWYWNTHNYDMEENK